MRTGRWTRFLVGACAAALSISGCGGGGGGGGGTPATTPITTTTQASQASAAAAQSATVSANTGATLSSLAAPVNGALGNPAPQFRSPLVSTDGREGKLHAAEQAAFAGTSRATARAFSKARALSAASKASTLLTNEVVACADGGSSTVNGSYDDATLAFDFTMLFANCREGDTLTNGPMTAAGSFNPLTGLTFTSTMGDGNGVIEAAADLQIAQFNGSSLFSQFTTDMTLSATEKESATGFEFNFTANGKEEYTDFIDTYTVTFTNFSLNSSDSLNATSGNWSGSETANGSMGQSWTEAAVLNSVKVTFTSFVTTWLETATYHESTADGRVATDFTPDALCYEGTFDLVTVTPIREDSNGQSIAGELTINGSTTMTFNADGSVTLTTGGNSTTYASMSLLEDVCPIATFDDSSTGTVVDPGSGTTTTGTTLLATLTWTGTGCPTTGCTSDMDLHLGHYATATPTAADTQDWHLYYFNDVVANIGVLDFDDTEGYGPEHISVTSLVDGYYTLFVRNFDLDLDADATVTVSLKIGTSTYSYPVHTFDVNSVSDLFRVTDFSVSSGAVTLATPDATLDVLEGGTYYAPKVRR